MTGYAKVQSTLGDKKLNIEIKTLNSKQLDLIVKLPAAYRSRELDIRALLAPLERGKVELTMTEESGSNEAALNDSPAARSRHPRRRYGAPTGLAGLEQRHLAPRCRPRAGRSAMGHP